MRILIPSLVVVAGLALVAAPSAAQARSLELYQEPFTSTSVQPAATRVVHDGSLYAEAFSASPAGLSPARPALAASATPYTESFYTESFVASPATPAATPSLACACPCGHQRG